MNFRRSFELGLAQFRPIPPFELSRGVWLTRPEGKRALVPRDCDKLRSLTCTHDQWNHQENTPSEFQPPYNCYPFLSWFPICLPVFSNRHSLTHVHTKTNTHTHSDLCAVNICPGWLPRKVRLRGKGAIKQAGCRNNKASVFSTLSSLFSAVFPH